MSTPPELRIPALIAHRGGGLLAPENTLVAIQMGASLGAGGIELDVRLTRDDQPVLLHDLTLERTTNGQGRLRDWPALELQALNAAAHFGFPSETASDFQPPQPLLAAPIPHLAQVAECAQALGLWCNLELKVDGEDPEHAGAVIAKHAAALWRGRESDLLLSSFSPAALHAAARAAPHLARGWIVDSLADDSAAHCLALGCVSLHVEASALTAPRLHTLSRSSLSLLSYTVDAPQHAQSLHAAGVRGIISDRPDLLARVAPFRP